MKVEFFLMVIIMRQQNPLERHTANGWESLRSSLPVTPRKTSGTIWWAGGWQDGNQGCYIVKGPRESSPQEQECGVWASWKERSLL